MHSDKHSSLIWYGVNYKHKKLYGAGSTHEGSCLALKHYANVEVMHSDKHTSLLPWKIN